jgi:hypothetical protein
LLGGDDIHDLLERWRRFRRADDVIGVWGKHAVGLLRSEGVPESLVVDLKSAAARTLGHGTGHIDAAAVALGATAAAPWTDGRAGRTIVALASVMRALGGA